jgi:glycosyltransferase involved in cell wall biosynthesis
MQELVEIGFNPKNLYIGYNSIPPKVGALYTARYINPTILYVGRLKTYKRVEYAIKILPALKKKFPNIKLIIGGAGDVSGRIHALVRKLNLEQNVDFLGYISERKKWELLQKSWVFIMPSAKEGWGITIIEAAKCATPSVGFDVAGVRDSIQAGVTGLLAKDKSLLDLRSRVTLLLSDPILRKDLGKNAEIWANRFRWSTTAKIFELLIEGIVPRSELLNDKIYPWDLDIGSDFVTSLADINK